MLTYSGPEGPCALPISTFQLPILSFLITNFPLNVLKARYLLEYTAEIGKFQRLILPLNRRIKGSPWYLNDRLTQVLGCQ